MGQGEVAVESGVDKVCDCVWYLRGLSESVLIAVAQRFIADMFSPNEFIQDRYSVSVLRKGTCIKRGKFMTRDDVIGEDMILATETLVDTVCPRTLTFVEVMTLTRNDLLSVCERYPDFDRRVRKAQLKLAIWRAFVKRADEKARACPSTLDASAEGKGRMGRVGFSQSIQT